MSLGPCPYETALQAHWSKATESARDSATDSAHDLAHIRRVWANCQHIAKGEGQNATVDLELLHAAALFHDLVNLPKNAPNRAEASRLSAEAAAPLARACGLPEAKLPALKHAIAAHSFSAKIAPQTLEAQILQDADRLDALGAIGLARMLMISGALNRPLYDHTDPLAQNRAPDDTAFALDHFQTKLFTLADTMHTETARQIATERTTYMRAFLARLHSEIAET
ncbi:HD domain-containing protein [Lentibacter sp.]|uniref:HD domain-containing protein n=1 Tax=Lentibacter sp. TaxID=2024994 RepID=UPI003F69FE85